MLGEGCSHRCQWYHITIWRSVPDYIAISPANLKLDQKILGSEQALAPVREPDTFAITIKGYICAANIHRQKKAACSEPKKIRPGLLFLGTIRSPEQVPSGQNPDLWEQAFHDVIVSPSQTSIYVMCPTDRYMNFEQTLRTPTPWSKWNFTYPSLRLKLKLEPDSRNIACERRSQETSKQSQRDASASTLVPHVSAIQLVLLIIDYHLHDLKPFIDYLPPLMPIKKHSRRHSFKAELGCNRPHPWGAKNCCLWPWPI